MAPKELVGRWNWLDCLLMLVVVLSILAAAIKGFIRELISLASVVAALAIAAVGYIKTAVWFEDLTRSHEVALAVGFLSLFVCTLIVGGLVSVLARKLIKTAGLQSFDRILGAIFGIIRGIAVDCVLLLVLVAFAIKPEAVRQSILAPYITTGARVIAYAMPEDLKAKFRAGFEKFRQALTQQDQKAIKD